MSLLMGMESSKRYHGLVPNQIIEVEVSQPLHMIPLVFFKGLNPFNNLGPVRPNPEDNSQDAHLCWPHAWMSFHSLFRSREARTSNGETTRRTVATSVIERHGEGKAEVRW